MMGDGKLASYLIRAHSIARPIAAKLTATGLHAAASQRLPVPPVLWTSTRSTGHTTAGDSKSWRMNLQWQVKPSLT